jgi:hypothetical protein
MNYFKGMFLLAIGIIGLLGCGSDNPITTSNPTTTPSLTDEEQAIISEIETSYQKTTFLLTDAPSDDFRSVVVDIQSPIVLTMEGGATTTVPLPNNLPLRVDLLELDGLSETLASAKVPSGTITKIKLTLAHPEITFLDGRSLSGSGIELTSELEIAPSASIKIPETQGITVQVDIDVANSVKVDVTGSGRLIFRPQGSAVHITNNTDVVARKVKGTVARILQNKHFLLKHPDRTFFLTVDAGGTTTEIITPDGKVTFDVLKEGQRVEVSGVITDKHILKAHRVIILPENFRRLRGVVTDLTPDKKAFVLPHFLERDQVVASSTLVGTSTKVNLTKVVIIDIKPTVEAATIQNDQTVEVYGLVSPDGLGMEAHMIVIHPERFRAFVTEDCVNNRFRVVQKRWLPSNFREISGVDTTTCASLKRGTRVAIFGKIIQPTPDNTVQVEAFEVKVLPEEYIAGTVDSVELDANGLVVRDFFLNIPAGSYGFEAPIGCVETTNFSCTVFKLRVVLSAFLRDTDRLIVDKTIQRGMMVRASGFFNIRIIRTATGEERREVSFLAISVNKEVTSTPTRTTTTTTAPTTTFGSRAVF